MSQALPPIDTEKLSKLKIVVAGDIMLDRYVHGEVTRMAPEAPVPVLKITREETMLGGAGNVLANLRGLGAQASIVSVIGQDSAGEKICKMCEGMGIRSESLIVLEDRPTTEKTRYVGNDQILMRSDSENSSMLKSENEKLFLCALKKEIFNADVLILSDYSKGSLTSVVIREAISLAKQNNIPVLVDPKRTDCTIYTGASVITPNLKELAAMTGMGVASDEDVELAAQKLSAESNISAVVVTRSERGASVIENSSMTHIPNAARTVRGVSGAGDTFISTLAVGIAAGLELLEAAELANQACGIVVSRDGTTPITANDLFSKDSSRNSSTEWDAARSRVKEWQAQGLTVGFTNGCFDILHAGHVTYLEEAASYCDRLVVGLNRDRSVKILKGPTRPVNDEASRSIVLAGLGAVDLVVLFGADEASGDNTPCDLLRHIRPDIIFKGGDYTEDQLPEAKVVRAYGGEVKIMSLVEGKSTTNIIKKISTE